MSTGPDERETRRSDLHRGPEHEDPSDAGTDFVAPRHHDPQPDTSWWFVLLGFGLLVVGSVISFGGGGLTGLVALVVVALGALLGSIGCIAVGVEMALARRDWLVPHAAAQAARATRDDTTSEPTDP